MTERAYSIPKVRYSGPEGVEPEVEVGKYENAVIIRVFIESHYLERLLFIMTSDINLQIKWGDLPIHAIVSMTQLLVIIVQLG